MPIQNKWIEKAAKKQPSKRPAEAAHSKTVPTIMRPAMARTLRGTRK